MAKTHVSPWDPVDDLETAEEIVGYVEVAFEDGDPRLIGAVLEDVVRAIERYGIVLEDLVCGFDRAVIERGFRREHADRVIKACQKFSRTPRLLEYSNSS